MDLGDLDEKLPLLRKVDAATARRLVRVGATVRDCDAEHRVIACVISLWRFDECQK
jgi:hypothetical protein